MTPRKPHLPDTTELMHINLRGLWQGAEDLHKFKPDNAPALSRRGRQSPRPNHGVLFAINTWLQRENQFSPVMCHWVYQPHSRSGPGIFTDHRLGSSSVLTDLDLPPFYKPSAAHFLSLDFSSASSNWNVFWRQWCDKMRLSKYSDLRSAPIYDILPCIQCLLYSKGNYYVAVDIMGVTTPTLSNL